MMRRYTLIMTMTACGILLAGCCTPAIVVPHALRCDADASLLASKCAKPQAVPGDATFETIVSTMREDRQALLECGLAIDALRDSVNRCNQQTDDLNRKIDAINKENSTRK